MEEIKLEVLNEIKLDEKELEELKEFQLNLANGGAGGGIVCYCKT
ncbi:hypothetical protein [Dubosiella newyorkensis]|nr:hypothetical protein [Dubosiella newyorkensis]